jgi:aminoglycoside/choline kinase family phosphotransferase
MAITPAELQRNDWLAGHLAARGETFVRAEQVRDNPAGAVFAIDTDRGRCYLKTCAGPSAHEPALSAALAAWFPQDVPAVLAVDPAQGWLLLDDAGPTLRERIRAGDDRARSVEMVRRFAALQRNAAARVDDLLALGVPDRRLSRLPELFESLLEDRAALHIGREEGVSEHDFARLQAFGPTLRALCDRLAALGLPDTIQHDDFHSGNVAVRDDDYRLFDWGESFVGPPLGSLLIALRDAKWILEHDDALLDAMREAYLAAWSDFAPVERLDEAAAISFRLAALGRALSWWSVLQYADDAYRAENWDAVPYWLLTFLNDTPMD